MPIRMRAIPSSGQVLDCFHAGSCLCDASGQRARLLVNSFRLMLRKYICKGTIARDLYDKALLVISITDGHTHAWYHVAFANLTSWNTQLLLGARVDVEVFYDRPVDSKLSCSFYKLVESDEVLDDFTPAHACVQRWKPESPCTFWRGLRRPVAGPARAHPNRVVAVAAPLLDLDEDEEAHDEL